MPMFSRKNFTWKRWLKWLCILFILPFIITWAIITLINDPAEGMADLLETSYLVKHFIYSAIIGLLISLESHNPKH